MQLALMPEFKESRLWKESLGCNSQDEASIFREHLRKEYDDFRKNAKYVAGEINRSLPDFTIHDISHSDSLWHLASLVSGSSYKINPMEAFVLGGSFLIHDLGLGLAAYPDGIDQLKREPIWYDTIAYLLKEKIDRIPTKEEIENPDKEIVHQATEEILRGMHAKRAKQLCDISWEEASNEYYLIENTEIRRKYGQIIGEIAQSHWLPVSRLSDGFPSKIGALPGYPSDWSIDPIKLACLFRAADAVHIDSSRAPSFLRILRKPSEISRNHWVFQEHLQQPMIENNRLKFTSGDQFPIEEIPAWWLCFDILKMIDRELCQIDALLADMGRERLEARGVVGTEDANRLAKLVPTKDWIPIDAQIKISNINSLIKKLGGKHLYGEDPIIPLRELIQNGCDAIRARRIIEKRPLEWGNIYVRLGKDSEGDWLEVEDTGIGMSLEILAGPFLDFGKSYWGSSLMINEFPGLLSNGYQSTGMFGIGFFSIFMAGDHVKIVTRRFDAAHHDTLVLEFQNGLNSRPILRKATSQEFLIEGGTRIRVWLKVPPDSEKGLLVRNYYIKEKCSLEALCEWLCPSIDSNLFTQEGSDALKPVIKSGDWINIDEKTLIRRMGGKPNIIEELETEELQDCIAILKNNIRIVYNEKDDPILRACISTSYHLPSGVVTVGGLRTSTLYNIAGILVGTTRKLARDSSIPIIDEASIAKWASEQAKLIKKTLKKSGNHHVKIIRSCGGDAADLEIAYSNYGWMNYKQIVELYTSYEEIILLDEAFYYEEMAKIKDIRHYLMSNNNFIEFEDDCIEFKDNGIKLEDNVIVTDDEPQTLISGVEDWPSQKLTLFDLVIKALSEAWSSSVEEIMGLSESGNYINIGTYNRVAIKGPAKRILNPNCFV